MKHSPLAIASIVLAGGQGTRLFPLTLNHCKPAVPFGGRYRLIDIPLSNSIHSDIRQIFVIAQFLTSELHHHLASTYQFDPFYPGLIDFLTPQELPGGSKLWFQGTADAIRKNLPTILNSPFDYFLILSGDQLYNINFKEMFQFAIDTDSDLTIATLPVPKQNAKRLGILKTDEHSKITDFVEKPAQESLLKPFSLEPSFYKKWNLKKEKEESFLASMGIYIFKRSALKNLLESDPREDFGKHLIPTEIKKGKSYAYIYQGYWEDIGTIRSYYDANLALTQSKCQLNIYDETSPIFAKASHLPGPKIKDAHITDSLLAEGSIIEAKEISHSIIGKRSVVKRGSIIRGTIMAGSHFYKAPHHQRHHLPPTFGIGENCLIENAIIDEHVLIGNDVSLTNEKKLQTFDGEGIFIRDGLIVITAGTTIPDNYHL